MAAIIGSTPMVLPWRSGAHSGDHSDTASGIVVVVLIGTGEAAQRLGVSPRRLRALIAEDRVRARWVGRQWLVDEADLLSVLVRPPLRPLGPRLSSALLAALSGQEPSGLSSGERRRLRAHLDRLAGEDEPAPLLSAWLRGRAEIVRLHTPASEMPAVAADPRLLASGISDPRTNLSSGHEFEGWVHREDLASVCKDHLLFDLRLNGYATNIWLRITDAPLPRPAPLGWVIADLADWAPMPRESAAVRRLIVEALT